MATNIDFKITTKAVTRELDKLAKTLEGLIGTAKDLDNVDVELFDRDEAGKIDKVSKSANRLVDIMGNVDTASASTRKELDQIARTSRIAFGGVSKAVVSAERNVETLPTAIRNIGKEITKVSRIGDKLKLFPEEQAKRVKDHEDAVKRLTAAQQKMLAVMESGDLSGKEYNKVTRELKEAENQVNSTSKALSKGQDEWSNMVTGVTQAQRALERLDSASIESGLSEAFSPKVINRIEDLRDNIKSVDNMMTSFGNSITEGVAKSRGMSGVTEKMIPPLNNLKESLAEAREENERFIRSLTKDVGNTRSAYAGSEKALQRQQKEYREMANVMNNVSNASLRLADAESKATLALSRGNVVSRESQKITSALARVRSDLISSYRKMDIKGVNLDEQFNEMSVSLDNLGKRLDAATRKQKMFTEGSAGYKDAAEDIERIVAAMLNINLAMDKNRRNAEKQAEDIKEITLALSRQESAYSGIQDAMKSVGSVRSVWERITSDIKEATKVAKELAAAFGSKLLSAIRQASDVIGRFGETAGTVFSGLQRAVQSAGGYFKTFGNHVKAGMDKAKTSMLEATASGYALMSIGSQIQMFGNMAFQRMGTGLSEYMDYEQKRIQAAIAATEFDRETGTMVVNNDLLDEIIMDMQRGDEKYIPEWMKAYSGNRPLPVTFSAEELAEGMYFYSAAIGQEITADNAQALIPTVNTIMQMAKISNTELESAIKGVMNIAMEFGLNPRDTSAAAQEEIQRITAQTGYLANISTMEVTDIVEMFKMVGPMANLIAGGGAGAGLDDTFMLAFMASEVGLRGGNVGRGVSQLFTSLLDPTDKMLEVMGKYFNEGGEAYSSEDYKAEFFEGGALKGGIMGFFNKLAQEGLKGTDMAQMVAEMFTNNATRAALGPLLKMDGQELSKVDIMGVNWDEFMEGWDEDPFKWMAAAAAETANSVSGWFAYMQNAWFQFTRTIIDSIKGPLMGAFRLIGSILFSLADVINDFPEIGMAIASIISIVAAVASIGGTALIAAGGLLILSRTLVTMGGVFGVVIRTIAMAAVGFISILPILALLIAAGAALAIAWNRDFLGIRSAIQNFKEDFDLDKFVDSVVRGTLTHLMLFGRGFKELIEAVLLGKTEFQNLGTMLTKIFGDQLGLALLGKIQKLRDTFHGFTSGELGDTIGEIVRLKGGFDDLSPSLMDMLDNVDLSKVKFEDLRDTAQGLLEQIFMGDISTDSLKGIANLSDALGMGRGGLVYILQDAGNKMNDLLTTGVAAASGIAKVWVEGTRDIYDSLTGLFSSASGEFISFGDAFRAAFEGFYIGITTTFSVALSTVASLIDLLTGLTSGLSDANDQISLFGGHVITLSDLFTGLGIAIGVAIGTQFLLRFAPVISLFTRIIPLVTSLTGVLLGLGGRLVAVATQLGVMVIQGGVMVAMLAAQTIAWAINTAAIVAAQAAKMSDTAATLLATSVTAAFTGTMGGAAVAALFYASALLAVVAQMALVVAGALALIGLFVGIASVVAVAAAGFLLAVTATQGLGAGFRGLVQLVKGIADGFMAIATPLFNVISLIFQFVGVISQAIGFGNGFYAMGVLIGVALGAILVVITALIAALSVLAIQFVVTALAPLAPFILIGAAIALLGTLIYGLATNWSEAVSWMKDKISDLGDAFESMWQGVELVFLTVFNAITVGIAKAVNFILDKIQAVFDVYNSLPSQVRGDKIDTEGWGISEEGLFADQIISINVEIDTKAARQEMTSFGKEAAGLFKNHFNKETASAGTGDSFLANILKSTGLEDIVIDMGIDIDNMSLSDLESVVGELMKIEEFEGSFEGIDMETLLMSPEDIQKSVDAWDMYIKEIDSLVSAGYDRQTAEDMASAKVWQVYGIEPKEVDEQTRALVSSISAGNEQLDAEAEKFKEISQKWEEAAKGWYKVDAATLFGDLYNPIAGDKNQSLVSWMAGSGWEMISKNIPEGAADWMNETEFLADFALGGGMDFAGEGVYGQNLHSLLKESGALDAVSQQTGIPVEVLLEGVPKFQAPEEFQAAAINDMVNIISDINVGGEKLTAGIWEGMDIGTWLDTKFGTDFILPDGSAATQFGADWSEMNQYAIGKALQGQDWNLADYIADSWGISVEEANAYLASHGVDPNSITGAMYETVEMAVLSGGGAFNVLTDEMYGWLSDATNQFATNTIQLTSAEFANIDDATKAILTRMGYTFVVNDYIPKEAYDKAKTDIEGLRKTITDNVAAGDYNIWQGRDGANLLMEGTVESWSEVNRYVDEATGELMVILEDVDGTQISIPAADYDPFKQSLDTILAFTTQFRDAFKTAYEDAMNAGKGVPVALGAGVGAIGGLFAENATGISNASLGVPDKLSVKIEFDTSGATEIKQEVESVIASAGGGPEGTGVKIKFDADLTPVTQKIDTYITGMEGIEGVKIRFSADITPMVTTINTYLTGMQGIEGVKVKFNANLTPMVTAINTYLTGMQGSTGVHIKFNANLTPMVTAINTYLTGMQGSTGVSIKFNADLTPMVTTINTYLTGMQGSEGVKIKFNADTVAVTTSVNTLTSLIKAYATTWEATFKETGSSTVASNIGNLNGLSKVYAVTWTGTFVTASDEASATAIGNLIGLGKGYAVTWTGTFVTSNDAVASSTIGNLIGLGKGYAVTWTGTFNTSGDVTAAVTIGNLISLGKGYAKTWTAHVNVSGSGGAGEAIRYLIGLLDSYDGSRTVSLNVIDNTAGVFGSVLGKLAAFQSKSITLTTYANTIASTVRTSATGGRIGSAGSAGRFGGNIGASGYVGQYSGIVGRATGGRSGLGELTLVGEQGPELVGLPTSSYVMTARQTERMFRESQAGGGNPLLIMAQNDNPSGNTTTNVEHQGHVINIYGDMHFGSERTAQDFFDAIDRESGVRLELARRGMRPSSGALD